jgi:hypothetical protein
MFTKYIGVDLGTVNVLIWVKGKGIVLQEPSVVAIALNDEKIVAVGKGPWLAGHAGCHGQAVDRDRGSGTCCVWNDRH